MNRPLWQIAAIRIVAFALLAALAQLAVVFADYYLNDEELGRLLVEQQVERLADGVTVTSSSVNFALPEASKGLFAPGSGYFARIRTTDGAVLFSACDGKCAAHFLPLDLAPPDFWVRVISAGKPLSVAGGGTLDQQGKRLLIEFATVNDAAGLVWGVLWHEVIDHLLVPMSILLLFVVGGTTVSVIRALRPVYLAARAADLVDPLAADAHLPTDGMPEEISHLTRAVNRAFGRVGQMMRAQKMLTSAIAHEVRTPLAVIKLELEGIDHPRARKAEADVDELAEFVGQLTGLARLEALEEGQFVDTDLAGLGEEIVASIAPWVMDRGDGIAFEADAAGRARIVPSLVMDICRNLIENAVRHTPRGTSIVLAAGPGPVLRISDDGRRRTDAPQPRPADSLGIGLQIVERVLALHGALMIRTETADGTEVELNFHPRHLESIE